MAGSGLTAGADARARRRTAARLCELAEAAPAPGALLPALVRGLGDALPLGGACWHRTDPATRSPFA